MADIGVRLPYKYIVILERCVDMPTEDTGLALAKAAMDGAAREGVNKIYDAIGNVFPFWDAKRRAVGTYIDNIKQSNLSAEDQMMAIANVKTTYKHLKNQAAIANIAQKAAKEGTDFSSNSPVDDEWLERFMDSAKFVSDETVQRVWGKVLANEFEKPNSTPPQVIRILSEITSDYAKIFSSLCNLSITLILEEDNGDLNEMNQIIIMTEGSEKKYINDLDINFVSLQELQTLGLIQYRPDSGFILTFDSEKNPSIHLRYFNNETSIIEYENKNFPIGQVCLTKAGESIEKCVEHQFVAGHFENVIEFFKQNSVKFS
ncbi:MAG: DUF2806 domain-containing protein [Oscillospiraceae bacterium]|nr:DUF2806 domain-containing protein [Oscillospiraceae bacterium]